MRSGQYRCTAQTVTYEDCGSVIHLPQMICGGNAHTHMLREGDAIEQRLQYNFDPLWL